MSDRDRDISAIRDGTTSIQKRKLPKHVQDDLEDEAFDAFMEIFHPNKNIRIPKDEDYIVEEKKPHKKPNQKQFQKTKQPLALPNSTLRQGKDLPDESITEKRWVRPNYNFDSLPDKPPEQGEEDLPPEEEEKKKPRPKRGGAAGGLMAKMEAAIDQETKKDEEKKLIEKEKEIKKQERESVVKATRQSTTFIQQKEAKMKEEAAKMQKIRETTEAAKAVVKPPTPPPPPPKPRTPTPEPIKREPTPKPPTPPPSPIFQWDNLEKYTHHPWFEPLKQHCQLKEIKIRKYEDFIPTLVELFVSSTEIVVKKSLLISFSELIREQILEQPHLVRKVSQGVHNFLNSDDITQRHAIRKLGLDWLKLTQEKSEAFGVEILHWIHHNNEINTLHELGLSDGADIIHETIRRWNGNVRNIIKKFLAFWAKRYTRATKQKHFTWKDCLNFFVEREREKRLEAARQASNIVMEESKRREGALVRIGDLHTGRRFEAKKSMAKTPLPPLELRIRDPGEPKVIRLALNHNKILLAPLGRYWTEAMDSSKTISAVKDRENPVAMRQNQVDIITAQFQKFYCPENSYAHHIV